MIYSYEILAPIQDSLSEQLFTGLVQAESTQEALDQVLNHLEINSPSSISIKPKGHCFSTPIRI